MDKPIRDIEYEMMMLGRYQLVASGAGWNAPASRDCCGRWDSAGPGCAS
jgi:hypothetical protein